MQKEWNTMIMGTGGDLKRVKGHPVYGVQTVQGIQPMEEILDELNCQRDNSRGSYVEVVYYFEVQHDGRPMEGLKKAARMVLEHGTLKPWQHEGDIRFSKPKAYDDHMSWALDLKLLGYNGSEGVESGLVSIAYPLEFFDKTETEFPLAQLMMAAASEPFSAFSFYQGAKILDIRLPEALCRRFPGIRWPHKRVREYLGVTREEPIIGTIVKPKTGLTPELFSRCVVEAALAGARFTKSDENLHLTRQELTVFVSHTARVLEQAGFDLTHGGGAAKGPRFLFAPHITGEPKDMMDRATAVVESGANALMFSPYYGGGFQMMGEIAHRLDVPVYAHTAGMNVLTGSPRWGMDASVLYRLAASYGAAFMQLTAVGGYLKPEDMEKPFILERLRENRLEGDEGMTLVIAGGLSPGNLGANIKALGMQGRMFLAGTSVYSHPDGPDAGVKALIQAYQAYARQGITDISDLLKYSQSLGNEGMPLFHALKKS